MDYTECCVLCGKEVPTESGKQYCEDCAERYLRKNEPKVEEDGDEAKSEN